MEPLDNAAKASRRHFGMNRDSAGCVGVFGQEQTSGLYTDRVSSLAEEQIGIVTHSMLYARYPRRFSIILLLACCPLVHLCLAL